MMSQSHDETSTMEGVSEPSGSSEENSHETQGEHALSELTGVILHRSRESLINVCVQRTKLEHPLIIESIGSWVDRKQRSFWGSTKS